MDFSSRWAEIPQQPHTTNPPPNDPYAPHYYNAPQSYPTYPYYSQPPLPHLQNPNPNPINPNPNLSEPPQSAAPKHEIPPVQYDLGLGPPGIDAYSINPYATHAGFEAQPVAPPSYAQHAPIAPYYAQDPNPVASVHTWAAKEAIRQYGADPVGYATDPVGYAADPVGYATTIRPASGVSPMVPTNPNPTFWTNRMINGAMRRGPKKTKIVQSAWCEICKIDCNSKDVLDKHKMGKKHKKKLEDLKNGVNAPTASTNPVVRVAAKKGISAAVKGKTVSGQRRKGAPPSAPGEDLETKKRKLMEGGAPPDSVRVCAICNVACNSETVFNFHLAGQKHAALVKKHLEMIGMAGPAPRALPMA
eukprot:TRINITY_DN12394_c0_g6_i1.p1 TRINITY_DN12394_c0_g6~~TRINITY_DN12394_c0_g6_i1.p1  ORF type:complete len:360 (+),score=27.18 TRINITY_DN12394_c0_g6_i1:98-1177(+)